MEILPERNLHIGDYYLLMDAGSEISSISRASYPGASAATSPSTIESARTCVAIYSAYFSIAASVA